MANMTTTTIGGVTYWLLNITGANNPSGYAEKLLTASTFVDKSILVSVPSATFSSSTPTSSDTGIAFTSTSGWLDGPTYLEGLDGDGILFTHGSGTNIKQWTIGISTNGTLGIKANVNFNNTALVTNGVVVQGSLAAPTISSPTSHSQTSGNVAINYQKFYIQTASTSGSTAGFIDANQTGSTTTTYYKVKDGGWNVSPTDSINIQETEHGLQMTASSATLVFNQFAGWIDAKTGQDRSTITILAPTVQTGSLVNESHKTSGVTYTALNAPVLEPDSSSPAQYWLYINEGYYTASKISLGTMVPDQPSTPDATSNKILSGYEAFDVSGHRIVGSMTNNGTITVAGTPNQAGTQISYGVSNFQAGYVDAITPATVNIYQGDIEENIV